MANVTDLRQLVLRRLADLGENGRSLSHRDAAARSGGRVSHATIGNIAAGVHSGQISDKTVEGLALALDVPRSEILRAMNRGHVASLRPFEAPDRWQRLTHAQRKVVIAVGNGLLDAYEHGLDDGVGRQPETAPGTVPLRRVARGKGNDPAREAAAEQAARDAAARNPHGRRP